MSGITFIFLLTWNGMFLASIDVAVAKDECNSNSDCTSAVRDVCCAGNYSSDDRECRSDSCSGQYCLTDGDCGGKGECCKFNKCVIYNCTECHHNSDCVNSEYCCKLRRSADVNVCRRSCIGESCYSDRDCGGPQEKCDWNKCAKSTSTSAGDSSNSGAWVLGVFLTMVVLGCSLVVYLWCRCRRKPPRQTRQLHQSQSTAAIISYKKTNSRATLHPTPSHFNRGQDFPKPQYTFPPPQQYTSPPPQHYTSSPPQHHNTSPSPQPVPPAYPWE